jgi:hypothetical protein
VVCGNILADKLRHFFNGAASHASAHHNKMGHILGNSEKLFSFCLNPPSS